MSRCSRSVVASASSRARCVGRWSRRKRDASVPSRQSGTSSRTRRRARATVSTCDRVVARDGRPARRRRAGTPRRSRCCGRRSRCRAMNSSSDGSTASIRGAGATRASVSPVSTVICGGIARPGLTSVWNVPRHSPPRTLTAPTSVIVSSARLPPVVSRSSTQNVTSASGVPRSSKSSKLRCRRTGRAPTVDATIEHEPRTPVRVKHVFVRRAVPRDRGAMADGRWRSSTGYLRSAIEFAVAIAAAGSSCARRSAFPAELKPFLRQPRVPTGRARASCAGRSRPTRTSAAGSPPARCPSWSTRSASSGCGSDDGWEERVAELVGRPTRTPRAQADDESAAARAERRREAAEQAAVRTRAELVALQDRLEDAAAHESPPSAHGRRRRRRGEHGRGRELAEARLAARHANDRAEAARAGWRPSRPSATRRGSGPRRPSAQRDDLLADRAERGGVAVSRRAGRRAARAGRLGAPAGRPPGRASSTSAPTARVAARPARRRGPRLAAGHRVPAAGARRAGARRRLQRRQAGLAGRRTWPASASRCLDLVETSPAASAATSRSCSTAPTWSAPTPPGGGLARVVLLAAGVTADDVIRAEVAGGAGRAAVVVVTNDQAVRRAVPAAGANLDHERRLPPAALRWSLRELFAK